MEAELTDLSVLRRRKQHLQELSEAYQVLPVTQAAVFLTCGLFMPAYFCASA